MSRDPILTSILKRETHSDIGPPSNFQICNFGLEKKPPVKANPKANPFSQENIDPSVAGEDKDFYGMKDGGLQYCDIKLNYLDHPNTNFVASNQKPIDTTLLVYNQGVAGLKLLRFNLETDSVSSLDSKLWVLDLDTEKFLDGDVICNGESKISQESATTGVEIFKCQMYLYDNLTQFAVKRYKLITA